MVQPQYRRAGTLWYVSDGFIWDSLAAEYRPESGRPLECSSKLFVLNPQPQAARVTVRFYHTDTPPTALERTIAPGRVEALDLATLSHVPHKQSFWIVVESDVPVLPQARHEDYTFWDPVPDAMVSVAPYPGPLADENTWVFPDCFQGGTRSWYEREMLTILNPGGEPITAHVRYLLRGKDFDAEERLEIPAERVASLEPWERIPALLGGKHGPPVHFAGEYAVRLDASGPVIAQTTRRARWAGCPPIIGSRSTMGFPLRPGAHNLWYYPGGAIVDRGVLPRGENCDVTWNLLFTHNLHEQRNAQAIVTFHQHDGSRTSSAPLRIPPMRSDLQWLHLEPWLGEFTRVGTPWAMTVSADAPVVPEVCCAEFEMWSQECPGAMTAVNFYPGPLQGECAWWLGIGQAGGSDREPVEWSQSYHLFNPGDEMTRITLSLMAVDGSGGEWRRSVIVAPGAVDCIEATEIGSFPPGALFAAKADGDRPFCAQTFGRAFTRGLSYTRSMYSFMGLPMQLTT